jgi:RNA-directed DNA polymerase
MIKKRTNKSCLDLTSTEAKQFFLKEESYFTLDLPPYFSFQKTLNEVDQQITNKLLSDFRDGSPRDLEDLNHIIYTNKDGKFSWRPFTLIHPAYYVWLVHIITETKSWELILKRFKQFRENKKIECFSIPVQSSTTKTDKAEQILHWWEGIEQRSLTLAIEFDYLFHTDIADCYPSIYTHAIPWALHGKPFAKANRNDKKLIGNKIDNVIQDFSHGQTNGIPQGSILCDFIAEIVLGYADLELSKKIKANKITNYRILRYRDDYRIFVTNREQGKSILKLLTEVLIDLGLKLNANKTIETQDLIRGSIKQDKLYWMSHKKDEVSLQHELLLIHELSVKFPNSGSLQKALSQYYDKLQSASVKLSKVKIDLLPLVSIVIDIAYHNPRVYPQVVAILSLLINKLSSPKNKESLLKKIRAKLKKAPNTGHFEIWLQRLTIKLNLKDAYQYNETLCKIVHGQDKDNSNLWNISWLKSPLKDLINSTEIIDRQKLDELPIVIGKREVDLFRDYK